MKLKRRGKKIRSQYKATIEERLNTEKFKWGEEREGRVKKKAGGWGMGGWLGNFPVRTKKLDLFCPHLHLASTVVKRCKEKNNWTKPEALQCWDGLDQNKVSIRPIFLSKSQPPVPVHFLERVPCLVSNSVFPTLTKICFSFKSALKKMLA